MHMGIRLLSLLAYAGTKTRTTAFPLAPSLIEVRSCHNINWEMKGQIRKRRIHLLLYDLVAHPSYHGLFEDRRPTGGTNYANNYSGFQLDFFLANYALLC